LARVQIMVDTPPPLEKETLPTKEIHTDPLTGQNEMSAEDAAGTFARPRQEINPNDPATWGKIPRNSPCPCGSGKKYKHCHGSPTYASNSAPA